MTKAHPIIPPAMLAQHLAVLGKTGSGKTSTAKLCVEQVIAPSGGEHRVCILDPIKSDWWGLTSSSNGKQPGLPFDILGGPHAHVALHAAAGKAIAELVAGGALRHSIIDMADFPPGGQVAFFTDFAPKLLQKMRGVLYLVIEEAHMFAPKERSGMGQENMSIHWAKTMATAGRSKGVRLIVATQRIQALHNAVLGSCDSMIVHRVTAPADQEPISKWLAANAPKETAAAVAQTLSSLKTGEGWCCSGEAKIFERRQFPRIHTYDNTATPTGDEETHQVRTAPVDQDRLRSIIGDAMKEAEANDPRKLKEQLAKAKREIMALTAKHKTPPTVGPDPAAMKLAIEKAVAAAVDRAAKERDRYWTGRISQATRKIDGMGKHLETYGRQISEVQEQLLVKAEVSQSPAAVKAECKDVKDIFTSPRPAPRRASPVQPMGEGEALKPTEQAVLNAAAAFPSPVTKQRIGVYGGRSVKSSSFKAAFPALVEKGLLHAVGDKFELTEAGCAIATESPAASLDDWLRKLKPSEATVLRAIVAAYPGRVTKQDVADATGTSMLSSSFKGAFPALRDLELIEGRDDFAASEHLMEGAAV